MYYPLIKAKSVPQWENRDTTAYRGDSRIQSRAIKEITRTPPANEGWISSVMDPGDAASSGISSIRI